MLCRSNKSSTSTCPGTSELSSTGRHGNHMVTKGGSSPPKPLPRSSVPPVPRPRTLPPPGQPHFQNSPSHSHSSPQHNINQQLIEDNDSTTYLPHSSRWVTVTWISYYSGDHCLALNINWPSNYCSISRGWLYKTSQKIEGKVFGFELYFLY